MRLSPLAGQPAPLSLLTNLPRLLTAFYSLRPDPAEATQRVAFGTSGHRGSALHSSFNEQHVLAITQAICQYREKSDITGPLFLGIDTHALSEPAATTALEVLAANGVHVMLAVNDDYTPTPAVSHAILTYNKGRTSGLADGILMTPSHNPPEDGGYKYNPTNGGPADSDITGWIEKAANVHLETGLRDVKRMPYEQALHADTTHRHDYLTHYVDDLANVIDMEAIRIAGVRMGVDPLGGAGVHYWARIADKYKLRLNVVSEQVDATFRFMSVDWDGRIRMDPSSKSAMASLITLKDKYDIAFACDTDHDRHGIVTRSAGLLPPNHYLAVCIDYLYQNRPGWSLRAGVGKTLVSSSMIDRVTARLGRKLNEVPLGFKWFAGGLCDGSLGFVGEESAGASFLRRDGSVWTTDKDGLVPALLSAEMIARTDHDPAEAYQKLTSAFGAPAYDRIDAPATPEQKKKLGKLTPEQITSSELAGEPIAKVLTSAPGNGASLGGLKVMTDSGWFAARPSGTENIYKIYAESFQGEVHLHRIIKEAQSIVDKALTQG